MLGDAAPEGEILGVRVTDLDVKEEVLAQSSDAVFTIPHFDGYAAVLVLLDEVELDELEELITESWITRAPKRVLAAYLATQPGLTGIAATSVTVAVRSTSRVRLPVGLARVPSPVRESGNQGRSLLALARVEC